MGNYIEQRIEALEAKIAQIEKQQVETNLEKIYSIEEVAKILHVDSATVNWHIRQGNIKPLPGKKRYRQITQTELENYLTKQTKNS